MPDKKPTDAAMRAARNMMEYGILPPDRVSQLRLATFVDEILGLPAKARGSAAILDEINDKVVDGVAEDLER